MLSLEQDIVFGMIHALTDLCLESTEGLRSRGMESAGVACRAKASIPKTRGPTHSRSRVDLPPNPFIENTATLRNLLGWSGIGSAREGVGV